MLIDFMHREGRGDDRWGGVVVAKYCMLVKDRQNCVVDHLVYETGYLVMYNVQYRESYPRIKECI